MLERLSLAKIIGAAGALLALLFLVGWLTRDDPGDKPYLRILGGGFIFNYRVSDVYYGFTAVVQRPLPTGSIVEARFEDPAGGPPRVVSQRMGGPGVTQFSLRSPSVRGVKAGEPYTLELRILDRQETQVIWSNATDFRSPISDDVVPEVPLTIGPGYTRNPRAAD